MQLSNYKQCLVGTVQLYNSKLKEHIGEMFAKNKISCDGVQQVEMFDARPAVNVTNLQLEEQIARCLTESEKAIRLLKIGNTKKIIAIQPFSQRMTLKQSKMRWMVFRRWKPSKTKVNELSAMTHLNRFRCGASWKNRL